MAVPRTPETPDRPVSQKAAAVGDAGSAVARGSMLVEDGDPSSHETLPAHTRWEKGRFVGREERDG
jgi:hypothetical protein